MGTVRSDVVPEAAEEAAVEPGTGRSYGTFGELLQGVLPETDRHFMVTFPLARWSTATLRYSALSTGIEVWPPHKEKARRIAELALAAAGRTGGGGVLELHSDLPEGKGMASSSADLVATVRAVGAAVGTTFSPAAIEALLRDIEPSDGVMYDEVVAYYHREVTLRSGLGVLPAMTIVGHDEGGQIDTIRHNRSARPVDERHKEEYGLLLAALCDAVRAHDLPGVGRIATRSAELNALTRPRPALRELRNICEATGGLGVVCAHSGTVLGVLIAADDPDHDTKVRAALAACRRLPGTTTVLRSLGVGENWIPEADETATRASRSAGTDHFWGT
ncbi:threonine kinase [Streptomyces sp. cf386]|uniref:GHMP family kinase ATP-binding protein n=1 Tax=Streptomyces sp. cf386 TaxID=1761904 RepID=UPI000891EC0F|nr:kinase [Streptomyces sp. cf386]SDN74089.1 threonine kinase [Streptomyces sp. cf386]